jgi:SAM-dependent methyltransferase
MPARLYHLVDPDWHRKAVGGLWDEIGHLQFEFLVARGLRPEHCLLDVGCGSLRGGIHFIRYLETGHYYGIDKNKATLESGRKIELERFGLAHKRPVLAHMENFEVTEFGRQFDFALAQSLFTHIPLEVISVCLENVGRVLAPGGRFYATFNEARAGEQSFVAADPSMPFYKEPVFRYDFEAFREACEGTPVTVEYIGSWDHPRGQRMLVFTRADEPQPLAGRGPRARPCRSGASRNPWKDANKKR